MNKQELARTRRPLRGIGVCRSGVMLLVGFVLACASPSRAQPVASSASFRLVNPALNGASGKSTSVSFSLHGCLGTLPEVSGKSTSASFKVYAGCVAALPAGLPADDDDGDGVGNATEQGAPNGGDGNDDGVPDFLQGNVTSLPSPSGSYETVEACANAACSSTCQLRRVRALAEADLPQQNPNLDFPVGLLEFVIDCTDADMRILYSALGEFRPGFVYEKFGPNPPGHQPSVFYTLPGVTFGSQPVGSDPAVAVALFHLKDGAVGDDTVADGTIFDQGGPAIAPPVAPAPALGPTAMAVALLALSLVSWIAFRRRSPVANA
ncbi:MAG: hypothetical protein ACRERC_18195 [Candidatus Binatia bacterium]